MTRKSAPRPPAAFAPVPTRRRADGWTPERQTGFIEALARTASVEAACRAVGMGTSAAYELRARDDAAGFREAWGIALDYAVHRLGEAALERALHGHANPVFYKGEQIGEHRRFDEKLTMFILRVRDPERYGRWREDRIPVRHPDGAAMLLHAAVGRVADAARTDPVDRIVRPPRPLPGLRMLTAKQEDALLQLRHERAVARAESERERREAAEFEAYADADPDDPPPEPDAQGGT